MRVKEMFDYIIGCGGTRKSTGLSWLEIAEKFELNKQVTGAKRAKQVKERWQSYQKTEEYRNRVAARVGNSSGKHEFSEEKNSLVTSSETENLHTVEDHARFHKIDTDIWEVEKKVSNYWEMNAGGGAIMPLHQLKIWWKRKSETLKELKAAMSSQMVLPAYKPEKIKKKGSLCVEMMITDHHLGKVGFDPETMEFNWTLKEAGKAYNDAIDYFLSQLDHSEISQFILPTGNDLLNIDNTLNTTTKGTPQMAPVFWETMFRYAKELTIATIGKLSEIAPVYVYMVKGNHDKGSVFSLGEAIGCYFSENPNVKVINETVKRPYHEFGKCMIGYTHGQELGFKNAGRAPSIDEPAIYGRTKFRAMHLGHLHTRKLKRVAETDMVEEQGGVDVEICPALCPVDRWHHEHLYLGNLRRSKCFVWDKEKGMTKEIYFNL